ncbi:hypothetical protein N7541_000782 [Penicillium brevicompactum]|uniref:Major facilitator superfamily (MFS) profile domain-containing protein n=1 Tax=Penicillium brevicompactum TaxID=5074 RepID=A0A9W9RV05_PENBR|nr:hypothetical protein N7541_000782 [Penicillium brevicompactum]
MESHKTIPLLPSQVDVEHGEVDNVIRDPYGRPLFPEPTTDKLDPLNWPTWRKHVIIFMVCYGYFMMMYCNTAPVIAFVQLQSQFNASYSEINWTFAAGNLGATVGPLFFSAMGEIIGRRPVMILGTLLGLIGTGWSSAHGISIESYALARFSQVFGTTPAITVGLAIINDLSWQHERGFRVGLWVLAIDTSCYLGPLFGSFLATYSQYWVEYHIVILLAILLIGQIAFLPETLYPRATIVSLGRDVDLASINIKRTSQLPFLNFKKIGGVYHPKPWATVVIFFKMFAHPVIVLPVLAFSFFAYWWIISIVTLVPIAYPDRSLIGQGVMFIGLLVGTLMAEALVSGRLGDHIIGRATARGDLPQTPEMRIWMGYPGVLLFAAGILTWGFAIENKYHIMISQLGFFLVGAGFQMTNTVIVAYAIDNCPDATMDITTFYSVFRALLLPGSSPIGKRLKVARPFNLREKFMQDR